jgi:hypothetical protein
VLHGKPLFGNRDPQIAGEEPLFRAFKCLQELPEIKFESVHQNG